MFVEGSMRRVLVLSIMLLSSGAAAAPSRVHIHLPQTDEFGRACLARQPQPAVSAQGTAQARRLDQLPPAAEIRTVLRSVNGCQRPVVIRDGIGGNPRAGMTDRSRKPEGS
jgi:hypothetical protein